MSSILDAEKIIIKAVQAGNIKKVKQLLQDGVDPNTTNIFGTSLLIIGIENTSVLEVLLKAGADPNLENNDGLSPLDVAKNHNYNDALKLFKKYSNSNIKRVSPKKALFQFSQGRVLKMLIWSIKLIQHHIHLSINIIRIQLN